MRRRFRGCATSTVRSAFSALLGASFACSGGNSTPSDGPPLHDRAQSAQDRATRPPDAPPANSGVSAAASPPAAIRTHALDAIPAEILANVEEIELVPAPDGHRPQGTAAATDPTASGPGEEGTTGGPPPPCGPSLADLAQRAPRLRSLVLVGCGDLGERHVAEGVPHLERLVLRNLSIDNDDLSAIGALAALRHVEFDRVRTQGEISTSVATTAPVRSLVLRDLPPRSPLVDLVATWSKSLTSLSLEGQWADSRTLLATKRAMGLERLEVLGTRAGNYGLHALAAHDALREIRLSGSGFTDATPLYLRNLPIERFECECPRLGDVGVGHLRFLDRLTHVALVEPAASPAGLARLGRVSSLRSIVLDGVELDDGTIAAWGALPDLTSLRIDSGRVALTTLAPLAGARKLETLVLRATDLGDTTVATLPAFANLTRLDLSNTSVGDRSLPAIARSGPLEDLDLSGTRVTRRLEPLAALRTLRSLRLAETDVVDDGIRAIGPLPHLEHLDLRATLVSDAVLDALATFGHLRTVDLRDTSVDPERARRILGARGIEVRTGPSVDTRGH